MSPAPAAATSRIIVRPSHLRSCLRVGWFLFSAIFFLAPPHALAAVSVTISPSTVNLAPNGTQQFTATVTGAGDTSVTWTIQEGISGGAVTGSGLYSAPAAVGLYHVVATSHADPTQSVTATVGVPGFVQSDLLYPGPCTSTLLPNGTILYTGGGIGQHAAAASNVEIYDPAASRSTATGSLTIGRCFETATLLLNGKVLFAGGQLAGGPTATAELYDPVSGTFTETGSMSVARVNHTATLLANGTVLIAGGGNCNSGCILYNTAELYDPSRGTFSPTGNLVVAASGSTATLLSNGKVLIAGGFTSSTDSTGTAVAELYDPATNLFTQTGSMVNPHLLGFTATLLQNGKVLLVGGIGGGSAAVESSAEVYDPSLGTFTQTGNLNLRRQSPAATLLQNGQVLIAGGELTGPNELYDPGTGVFSLTGSLQEPRFTPRATLLANGTVLIAGGNSSQALASIESYDPASGVFTSRSTFMNIGRTGNTMTKLADGRFLFIGGVDINGMTLTAEIYDPSTNKFKLTGSIATAREMHTATLLGNGTVLIVGGFTDPTMTTKVATAELYNPVSGTFGPAPSNPVVPRANQTATMLQNGKVLIAGGQIAPVIAPSQATTSTELYDPTAGTFTLAGNMIAPRFNHTATLLNDGRVLLAEGVYDPNEGQTGATYPLDELYDPSTGLFTPVGASLRMSASLPNPFDSILLANGEVLVDGGTIFDPTSNALIPLIGGAGSGTLTLLPTTQVFATGGGAGSTATIFDPVLEKSGPVGSMKYSRLNPDAALLPSGEVLIAGGTTAAQAEFYVGPVIASAPVFTSVSPNPVTGFTPVTITVRGANFTTGSVVMDFFEPLQTTFVSDTELTAIFPMQRLELAGTHPLEVVNIEDPRIAPFNLLVVNPQLQGGLANSGGVANGSIVSFPNVNVGSSTSLAVTFTDIGNASLKIDSISISGTNSAAFTFGPTSCPPALGETLAPQGVCAENIQFTPPAAGTFNAVLTVNYETPNSPWIMNLTGTGVGVPVATLAPLSLTFGSQVIGTTSAPQSFTITNTGSGALAISNIQVSPNTDYSSTTNCPSTLGLGASCSVNITFVPAVAGSVGGAVTIFTNDGLSHVVQLSGTGFGVPVAAIAPLTLTFGSQTVGTSSTPQGVIIASTGTASLAIASIVLSDTADFQMTSNCPANLAPNTNCSLGITFAPFNVGSISGTLVVTANDGSPHTIQLSGTGTGFAITPASGSSASAMVPAGQTAMYQLSLAPQAFSGSVTLTCAPVTAIPNATCSVAPNPVTLSGTTATVVTVSVITAPHTAILLPVHTRPFFHPGAHASRAAAWLIYLLLTLAMAAASLKFRRIPLALTTALLLLILITGCAGGNGGANTLPGGSTGTPAGTYQLQVTASSSGISSKTTLTLIVQ